MKKVIIISAVVLVLLNAFLFVQNKKIDSSGVALISQTNSPIPPLSSGSHPYDLKYDFSRVLGDAITESFGAGLKIKSYDFGPMYVDLKIKEPYTINAGNYRLVFSSGTIEPLDGYNNFQNFEVFNGNKLVFKDTTENKEERSIYRFTQVSGINFGGVAYYLIDGWSGGAHCCNNYYPIVIKDGIIKIGNLYEGGDYGIFENSFFVKNGQVYVWMPDTRFAYFLDSFAGSDPMFFPSFYRFDTKTGNLVPANNEFKTFYGQFVSRWMNEVEKLKKENYDGGGVVYDWPPVLTARAIYQLLSGQNKETVMRRFDTDFRVLAKEYGLSEFVAPYAVGWDFERIGRESPPDDWYATGALEDIKKSILKMVIGK